MNQDYYNKHKLVNAISKIFECISVGIFWIGFCIPIITIGASTTALYYTITKTVRHDRGYVWQEFWGSFKSNFKQSTVIWMIMLMIYAIVAFDYYVLYSLSNGTGAFQVFVVVFIIVTMLLVMWSLYVFPYVARFSNSTKAILKNSLMMMHLNLQWSILLLVLFVIEIGMALLLPISIVLLAGAYMLLNSLIMERIFRKHMSSEDLELEDERNRKYYN